jgi:hypothetical protein
MSTGWLKFDQPERRLGGTLGPRVKPASPAGEPYEGSRKWLLERLQQGPVSTMELRCPPWSASQNPAQRVLELRNRQYDIRTVRRNARTYYHLYIDDLPVGLLPEEFL